MNNFLKITILSLFISFAFSTYADFDQKNWQYQNKIQFGNDVKTGYVLLDMPSTVFEKANLNLSDLRIVNDDGEVPYFIATENESEYIPTLKGKIFNLGKTIGQSTSFEIDLGQTGLLSSNISIETPSENFKMGVEVYGTDDKNSWQLLNGKGQIFDYTDHVGDVKYRSTTIKYPDGSWRYLKIVINNKSEAPLNITGAQVERQVKESARKILYTPTFQVNEDYKNKNTDVTADLNVAGIPHNRMTISTNNDAFERRVILSESNDKTNWSTLSGGYIFAISTPKFSGKNLSLSYPESRKRYLKISILNGDNKPINITEVALSGIVRSILFNYVPGKNYALYVGNAKATTPIYDIEKVAEFIDTKSLPNVTLGIIKKNESYVASTTPITESSPYIIPAFLTLIVLILLFLVVRLFMTIKKQ